ncbi:hypothetical protein SSX86_007804 [Deinandra increscens subsp. villosa]|uniref:Uncharacterized protein n=1 Tax=Deinandra increscens subsp. villosa TaxID=3103831 RepID=A0AAP0DE55_9ASTR
MEGLQKDAGLSPEVARELKKLKEMISSVPGVVQPIPDVAPSSHQLSRFAPPICDVEIPKIFQTPSMKLPEEHTMKDDSDSTDSKSYDAASSGLESGSDKLKQQQQSQEQVVQEPVTEPEAVNVQDDELMHDDSDNDDDESSSDTDSDPGDYVEILHNTRDSDDDIGFEEEHVDVEDMTAEEYPDDPNVYGNFSDNDQSGGFNFFGRDDEEEVEKEMKKKESENATSEKPTETTESDNLSEEQEKKMLFDEWLKTQRAKKLPEIVEGGGKTIWGDVGAIRTVLEGLTSDVVLDNDGNDLETVR